MPPKIFSPPHNTLRRILLILLVCFATAAGARAGSLDKYRPEVARMVQQAQMQAMKADSQLLQNMNELSSMLQHYQKMRGSLPDTLTDLSISVHDQESRVKLRALTKNPYLQDALLNKEYNSFKDQHSDLFIDEPLPVIMQEDLGISGEEVQNWRKNHTNWLMPPGTLVVRHNTQTRYAIWGAGIDGKPIVNAQNGELIMLYRDMMQ